VQDEDVCPVHSGLQDITVWAIPARMRRKPRRRERVPITRRGDTIIADSSRLVLQLHVTVGGFVADLVEEVARVHSISRSRYNLDHEAP